MIDMNYLLYHIVYYNELIYDRLWLCAMLNKCQSIFKTCNQCVENFKLSPLAGFILRWHLSTFWRKKTTENILIAPLGFSFYDLLNEVLDYRGAVKITHQQLPVWEQTQLCQKVLKTTLTAMCQSSFDNSESIKSLS